MAKNKKIRIIAYVLGLLVVLMVGANYFISDYIEKKIHDTITQQNSVLYRSSVKNVQLNLIKGSLKVTGLEYQPTDITLTALMTEKNPVDEVYSVHASEIRITGFELLELIRDKQVDIEKISFNELRIKKIIANDKPNALDKKKNFNPDSIYIENITGLKIEKLAFERSSFMVFNISTLDTVLTHKPIDLELEGIQLEPYSDRLFRLKPLNELVEINDVSFKTGDKNHFVTIGSVRFNPKDNRFSIEDFRFKPVTSLEKIAEMNKYNDDVADIEIKNIEMYRFDIRSLLLNTEIKIDSILINDARIELFKDKRKPFNQARYIKLPQDQLKEIKVPLEIKKIELSNTTLILRQKFSKRRERLYLTFDKSHAVATNITNNVHAKEPIRIVIESKLMDKADLYAEMTIPVKEKSSTFYFKGSLGATKFKFFDRALYPAMGLKILKGDLHRLTFKAQANNIRSHGTMVMIYNNLEAEVLKAKSDEDDKFLTWMVNHLIHKSNPGKNKSKPRVAAMKFERVTYKGFGNYIWKTLQSGIVNSIAPGGMTEKRYNAKEQRKLKRKQRKNSKK